MRKALLTPVALALLLTAACGGGAAPAAPAAPTTAPKTEAKAAAPAATAKTETKAAASPAPAGSPRPKVAIPPGPNVTLRFAIASNLVTPHGRALVEMKKNIEERSGGRVQLDLFPDNQLGNQTETNQGVMQGNIDLSLTGAASLTAFDGKFAALDPWYLFDSEEHFFKVMKTPVADEMLKSLESKGAIVPGFASIGFRGMGNSKKPVRVPDDLRGLKFRMQPSPIIFKSFEALGGVPIDYDYGQVYTAMRQGILDGVDVVPTNYPTQKFHEVGKYYTWTKHQVTPVTWIISKQRHDTWPKEIQDLVLEEARIAIERTNVLNAEDEKVAFDQMRAGGAEIILDVDIQPFRDKTKPVWAQAEEKAGKEYFTRFLDAVEKAR